MKRLSRAITLLGLLLAGTACSKTVLDPRDYPMPVETPPGGRGATIARIATTYVGAPYVWSGSSPSGFDCSGLVSWAYAQAGLGGLPHFTGALWASGTHISASELAGSQP